MSKNFGQLEEALWGKRSVEGNTDTGPQPGPSPFRQPMQWIKQALGLQSGNPPQSLEVSSIVSAMDVMQGGWPFVVYQASGLAVAGPALGTYQVNMMTPDATSQYVLLTLSVQNQSPANAYGGTVVITAAGSQPVTSSGIPGVGLPPQNPVLAPAGLTATQTQAHVATWAAAAGGIDTTVGILGARAFVVPPGFTLAFLGINLLVGDTLIFNATWAKIPAGFKAA